MVPLKNYLVMWMDGEYTEVNCVTNFLATPEGLTLESPCGNFHILDKSKVRFIAEK